jgi:hypothetical protein
MEDKIVIPGEVKDRIVKETHARIEACKAKGMPVEQALSEIMPWLEEQQEVEGTWTYRETDLTLRFADGTRVGILLGRERAYGPLLGGLRQAYGPPLGDLQETKGGDSSEEAED